MPEVVNIWRFHGLHTTLYTSCILSCTIDEAPRDTSFFCLVSNVAFDGGTNWWCFFFLRIKSSTNIDNTCDRHYLEFQLNLSTTTFTRGSSLPHLRYSLINTSLRTKEIVLTEIKANGKLWKIFFPGHYEKKNKSFVLQLWNFIKVWQRGIERERGERDEERYVFEGDDE